MTEGIATEVRRRSRYVHSVAPPECTSDSREQLNSVCATECTFQIADSCFGAVDLSAEPCRPN